jgi:hypothetical protein
MMASLSEKMVKVSQAKDLKDIQQIVYEIQGNLDAFTEELEKVLK